MGFFVSEMMGRFGGKNKPSYFVKQKPKKIKKTLKNFRETCLDWDLGSKPPNEQVLFSQ